MALSDQLQLVNCGVAELADAQALSDAVGWNQTVDDWLLFIRHGKTTGYRNDRAKLVATAAALAYGETKGWVSMVLVAEPWRHQGLATRLLNISIDHLRQCGATPHLDATPAGAPAYRKAGFAQGFTLSRWQGTATSSSTAGPASICRAERLDLEWAIPLDVAANGMERGFLLHDFLARAGTRAWAMRDRTGFVIRRQGRRAAQIGPLVACDEHTATALLLAALDNTGGPVFLDLPDRWHGLAQALAGRGFVVQRSFVRMALGGADLHAANDTLFVLAGPEFG
ncbi:MAG: GNAT family N-acetyltransferase [Betaproteobacteria bacterium]